MSTKITSTFSQTFAREVSRHKEWLFIGGLILMTVLLRLPFLEEPFDNNSAANAYHARLIIDGEPLYSSHHPAHHMPALYYLYALTFSLLGDSVWTIKLVLIPWTIFTAYLLFQLGRHLMGMRAGLLAAVFYVILTAHIQLFGATGQRELFANLPRVAAFLLLARLITGQYPDWQFLFVGLLAALTFLFKATYLSPLALAGTVLLVELWRNRLAPGSLVTTLARLAWLSLGFLLGLLPVLGYFTYVGLLSRFLQVFTLGQEYVQLINVLPILADHTWLLYPLLPLLGLAVNNAALLVFSLAGVLLLLINPALRRSPALYVVIWYLLSFVEAGLNRRFFLHYYLLIVPPLALLSAWFLWNLYDAVKNGGGPLRQRAAALLFGTLLLTTLAFSVQKNSPYYYHYLQYRLGHRAFQAFLMEGMPETGPKLVQLQRLADYINARTAPDDQIYYWSFNVQLYYLTERRAPVDIIWPEYVEATGPYSRIFHPETRYIIVDKNINMDTPAWMYAELSRAYALETVIDEQEVYRRIN